MSELRPAALGRILLTAFLGAVLCSAAAWAAVMQLTIKAPFAVSDGDSGDKPKIQRVGDGTLVLIYGDNTPGAGDVYDAKADAERPARDAYVKTCKPGTARPDSVVRTCDVPEDLSAAQNLSNSALKSTISTAWKGGDAVANRLPFPGDIDKVNIKTSGPLMVATWIGNYCPDGDLAAAGIQAPVQRAIRYDERNNRVVPFACTWVTYSINNGVTWRTPVQLSTGERDAKQEFSAANVNTDPASPSYRKGQVIISWQEDPQGLQLGEAEGPGDGASGAKVNGGTDLWYAYATVDLSVPNTPADDFVLASPVRLTDNWQGRHGVSSETTTVFDGSGNVVGATLIEYGLTGASRANIGLVGATAIVAYEESKGSEGLAVGKFIRYHTFRYDAPPSDAAGKAGCIISDPLKSGRRVRFLAQSAVDAGPGGINIAIFWREGIFDHGGPADIVLRRGMGGLQPVNLVPPIDPACTTSDYGTAAQLANAHAENVSSNTASATSANLADDTELNAAENALAHRGILRGEDLWIGWTYTSDLSRLWAQLDNYNFWMRKYTVGQEWGPPVNITKIQNLAINVREPRMMGTPKSNQTACPTGDPSDSSTTDPTLCQNADVIIFAWGTQENVPPSELGWGADLGIYITVTTDAAQTFAAPTRYSTAAGSLFQDDEYAFESQLAVRPDGRRFYGVWNQGNALTGITKAVYARGDLTEVELPPEPPSMQESTPAIPAPTPAPVAVSPGNLQATIAGRNVTLTWVAPADGTPVQMYRVDVGPTPGATTGQVVVPGTSLTVSDVPDGVYFVRVYAVTAAGPSHQSNELLVRMGNAPLACAAPPGPPSMLAASVSGRTVRLQWAPPSSGTAPENYLIVAGSAPGLSNVLAQWVSAQYTSFIADAPDGTYYVRLAAANACGVGVPTSEVVVPVRAGTPSTSAPHAPVNLAAQVAGSVVTLTWNAPVPGITPTRYIIQAGDAAGKLLRSFDTGNAATTFTAAGVLPGTYLVRVAAGNAAGVGPFSGTITVTVR